jgi:hypothetical protein
MSDLLKEAIADAKAVRATALANAKAALEESFKPTLEAMLAEKLKSEIGDDVPAQSSRISNPSPAHPDHDVDDEGRSRPLTINRFPDSGQGLQEEEVDEEVTSEELDEILAELEREMGDEPTAPAAPAAEVPPVAPPMAPSMAPVEPAAEMPTPVPAEEEEVDEEINLQELLDTLSEEVEDIDEANKEDSMESEEVEEAEPTKESVQLAEALHTVQYLRDQLNEINLLNAKLLYTNKLFNKFTLNQAQKMKVVETFDLTHSIREVKLSYKILSESLSSGGSAVKKLNTAAHTITEGLASKPVASTAPKKQLIVENSNVMASRFQRLAGIKK